MIFHLWQELRNVNQKIAQKGDDLDFYSKWCPRQDLNLHLETRLAPEASASASFATRACTDYSTPHGLRDILSHSFTAFIL